MRFQKGIGSPYPRVPRGPGRGDPPYRVSRKAYQARLLNLARWVRPRTYSETRRIEIEIALGTHRGESYRAMAGRLGLRSHCYCWRVARRYRQGLIPSLPPDEKRLVALCDSLGLMEPASRYAVADTALAKPARANVAAGEEGVEGLRVELRVMTVDENIAETWREVGEWKRRNPPRYDTRRRISIAIPH